MAGGGNNDDMSVGAFANLDFLYDPTSAILNATLGDSTENSGEEAVGATRPGQQSQAQAIANRRRARPA